MRLTSTALPGRLFIRILDTAPNSVEMPTYAKSVIADAILWMVLPMRQAIVVEKKIRNPPADDVVTLSFLLAAF